MNHHHQSHGWGRQMALGAAGLVLAALVLLWSWNSLAPLLWNGPAIRFKEALAMALGLLAAGRLLGLAGRRGHGAWQKTAHSDQPTAGV